VIKLYSSKIQRLPDGTQTLSEPVIARLAEHRALPPVLRQKEILLVRDLQQGSLPEGYLAYFVFEQSGMDLRGLQHLPNVFTLPDDLAYLSGEDIIRFDANRGALRVLYRRHSAHNSILVTERCNNYCLMCSQPPKRIDDSFLVKEILQTIPLMSPETREIGITGGEPTLLGDDLLTLIRSLKNYLPNTALHILSNGRAFSDLAFTEKLAKIDHPDLMIGIPLYSDISNIHNFVVQADHAYDETLKGILNLKRYRQRVEIRVVLHKQTYARLPQLAEFLARNLLMVDHVALMGLEMMGFTKANLESLWIDPVDYQAELYEACQTLARARMNFSIYNHQLCLLDSRLWQYAVRSISDWKNEYMPECASCTQKDQCGGFFSSAHYKYSDHIKPFELSQV
jgi:His-Xaa-Ser system radical SAM maturase HxsC